jgi:vitamin B12 transporter
VYGNTFTYSANPSWLIHKRVKLFANYSTGFKAPTLSQLYGRFGANEHLRPEESKSLEGGAQFVSNNNNVTLQATAFSRKLNDAIVYTTGYINLDKQHDVGFEMESTVKIRDHVSIRAFYAFVDGNVVTKKDGRDTTFNNLIRRPRHSFGVTIGYEIKKVFFTSLHLKTFGRRNDLFFDMDSFAQESIPLRGYQLLDLYMEYRLLNNKLTLFIDAKNLLNQHYTEVYGYNTQRFNLTTGISFTF